MTREEHLVKVIKRAIVKDSLNLEKHCDGTEFKWHGHTVTIGRLFGHNGHRQVGYSITIDGLQFVYDDEFQYDDELEIFEKVD